MFERVEEYEQSGKSQKAYCQAAGIGLAKLNYWIREYRNRQQPSAGFLRVDTHRTSKAICGSSGRYEFGV